MNGPLLLFAVTLVGLQFMLPRRWAFVPLLIAACHTGAIQILGDFTIARLVIAAGLFRAVGAGMLRWEPRNSIDFWVGAIAGLALVSSVVPRTDVASPFMYKAGMIYNILGTYLYGRAYLRDLGAWRDFSKCLSCVLIPLALLMVVEGVTGKNQYSLIGARRAEVLVRNETTRSQGPFGGAILAGTAGGVSLPLMFPLWRSHRRLAAAGLGACIIIVMASGSSGPIASMLMGAGAVALWHWRSELRRILVGGLIMLTLMQLVKERPIWYLMALTDFVGGSTGWHRAKLIDASIEHIGEWWLTGTDYTRHWMPYGLPSVPQHTDLTNYYIHLGVLGGLPLLLCFVFLLVKSFRIIGRRIQEMRVNQDAGEFMLWCSGSALFAHSITFLSISYYDQMYVLFYLLIAAIPALAGLAESPEDSEPRLVELGGGEYRIGTDVWEPDLVREVTEPRAPVR